MHIEVDEDRRILAVWLTGEEQGKPGVEEGLRPLYRQFSDMKYTVAVFRSGDRALYPCTRELLLHNRMQSAEREALNPSD